MGVGYKKKWRRLMAPGHGVLAALPERTARWQLQQTRDHTGDGRQATIFNHRLIDPGNRFHQPQRVGVAWVFEEVVTGGIFDDMSRVHHGDGIRHFRNDPQVMGNQQNCGSRVFSKPPDQVQYLSLNGDVQSRGWNQSKCR